MGGQPVELARPLTDPVGHDVHLVAALGEPPGPAQEDDRLSVADTQQAERSVGHGAELYPGPWRCPSLQSLKCGLFTGRWVR